MYLRIGTSWPLVFGPWAGASGAIISHDYGGNNHRCSMLVGMRSLPPSGPNAATRRRSSIFALLSNCSDGAISPYVRSSRRTYAPRHFSAHFRSANAIRWLPPPAHRTNNDSISILLSIKTNIIRLLRSSGKCLSTLSAPARAKSFQFGGYPVCPFGT